MALAAYLTQGGHTHSRLEHEARKVFWVFPVLGDLAAMVEAYMAGEVPVYPLELIQEYMDLRAGMFAFLDGLEVEG